MEYDIKVQTMTAGDAGYEGDIKLTIIGSACDAEIDLSNDRWFREDFGSGSKVSFQIKVDNCLWRCDLERTRTRTTATAE